MKKELMFLVVGMIFLAGCSQYSNVKELQSVEIREVEEKALSSITDFRENSIRGPQYIDEEAYVLEVSGLVGEPKTYTYSEVLDHQAYSKIVTLYCVEGWSVTLLWEGVLLKDLFSEVDVSDSANTVIFYAEDGYSSALPLDYIVENDIILAYKQNNVTLPPENGFPFQVVAEDKFGYKWVKWVTKIELSDDPEYLGFWESRGWNNQADIN